MIEDSCDNIKDMITICFSHQILLFSLYIIIIIIIITLLLLSLFLFSYLLLALLLLSLSLLSFINRLFVLNSIFVS